MEYLADNAEKRENLIQIIYLYHICLKNKTLNILTFHKLRFWVTVQTEPN